MKKKIFLLYGITVFMTIASCGDMHRYQESALQEEAETEKQEEVLQAEEEENIPYSFSAFSEEMTLTVDGRSFQAENAPENSAEEAVFWHWMANFLQDIDAYKKSTADQAMTEGVQAEFEQSKHQISEFTLHVLESVSVEEEVETAKSLSCTREEAAEKYDLTDSMIVRAEWTEEREEPVNYGNGFHKRYYLCGKQKGESIWRIFEFGVM